MASALLHAWTWFTWVPGKPMCHCPVVAEARPRHRMDRVGLRHDYPHADYARDRQGCMKVGTTLVTYQQPLQAARPGPTPTGFGRAPAVYPRLLQLKYIRSKAISSMSEKSNKHRGRMRTKASVMYIERIAEQTCRVNRSTGRHSATMT
jgi:hypothetical protein